MLVCSTTSTTFNLVSRHKQAMCTCRFEVISKSMHCQIITQYTIKGSNTMIQNSLIETVICKIYNQTMAWISNVMFKMTMNSSCNELRTIASANLVYY